MGTLGRAVKPQQLVVAINRSKPLFLGATEEAPYVPDTKGRHDKHQRFINDECMSLAGWGRGK